MRRKIVVLVVSILGSIVIWRVSYWVANGGWPSSGKTSEVLPQHIQYVMPADGEKVESAFGFCVHFNYSAGNGMNEETKKGITYFFDGVNVTKSTIDIITLEYGYPDPVGEPCYTENEHLSSGWHTAKVRYTDSIGEKFVYMWRFQVLEKE